eukprot:scaffold36335_cov58-Attheya_sp.AAC.1
MSDTLKDAPTPSNGMWNLLTSAHDVNIGTEFLDQLDFDGESVDSNPPNLDDLDIDLEEINL